MNAADPVQSPVGATDMDTPPPLLVELADLVVIYAIRLAPPVLNRQHDTPNVVSLLNVRPPHQVYPSPVKAALMQMWWIDLDAVSTNPRLPFEFLDFQLSMAPARPLQYSRFVLRKVLTRGRVDVLKWWFAHHYRNGGPLFFDYDPMSDLGNAQFLIGQENGKWGPGPAMEATLKWCFSHSLGIDLDAVSTPIQRSRNMETSLTAIVQALIGCGAPQATLNRVSLLLGPGSPLQSAGLGWYFACKRKDTAMLDWLQKHASVPSMEDFAFVSPMCFAFGQQEFVQWCLGLVSNPNHQFSLDIGDCLAAAASFGQVEHLEWCVQVIQDTLPQAWKDSLPIRIPLDRAVWRGAAVKTLDWLLQCLNDHPFELYKHKSAFGHAMVRNDGPFLRWCHVACPDQVETGQEWLSAVVTAAAERGHVEALQFWYESGLFDKFIVDDLKVVTAACKQGQVQILRWWKDCHLPIKPQSSAVMDDASQAGHVDVLDWWLHESGLDKNQVAYTNKAWTWDSTNAGKGLSLDKKDEVLDWWEKSGCDLFDADLCLLHSNLWKLRNGVKCDQVQYTNQPLLLELQLKAGICMDLGNIMDFTHNPSVLDWCLSRSRQLGLPLKYSCIAIQKLCVSDAIEVLEWWSASGLPLLVSHEFHELGPGHLALRRAFHAVKWMQNQLDLGQLVVAT